jgi:hypothetical protein
MIIIGKVEGYLSARHDGILVTISVSGNRLFGGTASE